MGVTKASCFSTFSLIFDPVMYFQRFRSIPQMLLKISSLSRNATAMHLHTQPAKEPSSQSSKPFTAIPGPKPLPYIGNLKEFRQLSEAQVREDYLLSKLIMKYGNICKFHFMNNYSIVVNDADAVRSVFDNEGSMPTRGTTIEQNHKWIHENSNIPISMLFSYKNDWKKLRSATTKQVTPRKISHFAKPISAVADDLCDYIEDQKDSNGWMTDICYPMELWSMKGVTKMVLNENINVFDENDATANKLVRTAKEMLYACTAINQATPLYKVFPTKAYRNFINCYNDVRKQANDLLNNHYVKLCADIEAGTVDEDTAVGLLDQWLIEGKLTHEEAVVQACDMIQVGIGTTGNTGAFMLYELAKNHDIQEAVRKEIMEVVGPNESPTVEQLQKLGLVRKCVKESIRLHPVSPFLIRETATDMTILGYEVPAGTACYVNLLTLGVDPRYFKDPMIFNPNRWSDNKHNPYAFLPFGFGPRMCYGRRLAELELYTVLTRIIQRFRISTDQKNIRQSIQTLMFADEPVRVNFTSIH